MSKKQNLNYCTGLLGSVLLREWGFWPLIQTRSHMKLSSAQWMVYSLTWNVFLVQHICQCAFTSLPQSWRHLQDFAAHGSIQNCQTNNFFLYIKIEIAVLSRGISCFYSCFWLPSWALTKLLLQVGNVYSVSCYATCEKPWPVHPKYCQYFCQLYWKPVDNYVMEDYKR